MIGRLVQQQHIGPSQQQLGQLYTHTPSTTELRCRTVKILPAKSQPHQCTFYLSCIIGTSHHQKAFIVMGEFLNQFTIVFWIIICSIRQLLIHSLNTSLQLKDMFKSHLRLFHHSMFITQNHDLRQIAYRHITRNRNTTWSRRLYSCQYLKHSRLTGPILPDQRNTISLIDNVWHILKQRRYSKLYFQIIYWNHSFLSFCKSGNKYTVLYVKKTKYK